MIGGSWWLSIFHGAALGLPLEGQGTVKQQRRKSGQVKISWLTCSPAAGETTGAGRPAPRPLSQKVWKGGGRLQNLAQTQSFCSASALEVLIFATGLDFSTTLGEKYSLQTL